MADDLFKLNVDGKDIEVPRSYTLMQACEEAGAEVVGSLSVIELVGLGARERLDPLPIHALVEFPA